MFVCVYSHSVMRQPRFLAPAHHERAYYHCVSRVVGRAFLLKTEEKEQFVKYMRMYERFCGVRVMSYCIMSNHFHILVEVPKRPEVEMSDEELVALVRSSLGEDSADALELRLTELKEKGINGAYESLREGYFKRMWNVSLFMKVLKQRFTQWYNKQHQRTRIRYFCDGKAIGTKSFIEDLFQSNREKFSKKRKDGARLVKGRESDDKLYSLRDLKKNVFS